MFALLALAGCTSSGSTAAPTPPPDQDAVAASPSPAAPVIRISSATAVDSSGSDPVTAANPTPTPTASTTVGFASPVQLRVTGGTLSSVQVSAQADGTTLDGDIAGDTASWVSQEPPKPSLAYKAVVVVTDTAGQQQTQTLTFQTATVPDNQRISFNVTPDDGTTVGIGQPIVVRFLTPITERAALENVMSVEATDPAGSAVTGSWHWLNGSEVHWRPKVFWTPGTKVHLDMTIAGLQAGPKLYGRKNYAQTFTIGASQVTKVDAKTHRLQVFRDDKLIDTWETGTGKKGLETYSGTYIVLGKAPVVQMDSCSARITCDKLDPDYYNEKEYWATRITASGTFLHAADWDPLLGKANVSHGCIHLSDADAETYFKSAVPGDLVIVSNSGRGPQERIDTQDPGLYDWNIPWEKWTQGSALA